MQVSKLRLVEITGAVDSWFTLGIITTRLTQSFIVESFEKQRLVVNLSTEYKVV